MKKMNRTWQIDIPAEADVVTKNAAQELRQFFRDHLKRRVVTGGDAACRRVTLGTATSTIIKDALGPKPLKTAGNRRTRRLVACANGDIIVTGSDERAVLDGVFALEERLLHGRMPAEFDHTWSDRFALRLGNYYCGEPGRPHGSDEYRTYARQGFTHMLGNGIAGVYDHAFLHHLVVPRGLPMKHDPEEVADFQRLTNKRIAVMASWGIKPWFYVFEPQLPPDSLSALPKAVLGSRYVYWKKEEIKTLCVRHPLVQQYYRALIQDFVRAYPEVDILHFYCDDGSYWFCDPARCLRCGEHGDMLDYTVRHPLESHVFFLNLLQEAAREIQPAFSVGMSTIHLEDQLEKKHRSFMANLASGTDIVLTPHYSDGFLYEKPSAQEWRTWKRMAGAGKRKGVRLFAWDEYTMTESLHLVKTLPLVHATADKLAHYACKGVENLWVEGSVTPGVYNPANQAWQLLVTGEVDDPKIAVKEAVCRTYGNEAAPSMQEALAALHKGLLAFNKDELAIDLYLRFLLGVSLVWQLQIPVAPLAIERELKKGFFVYTPNGKRVEGMRHWLPTMLQLAQAAIPHFDKAVALAEQGVKKIGAGRQRTSAVLDHADLRRRSARDMTRETAHALDLWTALFRHWTHRLEAVNLVHMLNVYNDFQPPYAEPYRRTGKTLIGIAESDCDNLERLARLIERIPEKREVLKFQAHASSRVDNRAVVRDIRQTLSQTRQFLKNPWPELYTFWQSP